MTHPAWTVLGHEPLQKLTENLWWVRGDIPRMSLKRTMVIARTADGRLLFHSPIALDAASMAELEAWGTPAFLVVPGVMHRLDAPAYKQRYPELRVFAPSGARAAVEEVVPVDGTYEDFPSGEELRLEPLRGVGDKEGILLVRSGDGESVVLNDAVFNMDRKRDPLGFLFTSVFGSAPGPRVSRLVRWTLVKDKDAFRAELLRLAELPRLQRLIVAHEKVAHGEAAAAALREAATYV